MIETLEIENFKSIQSLKLKLRTLNVITGMNGVGKSSVIQCLLLLRQAFLKHGFSEAVSLDGELTGNLGTVKDIRFSDSNNEILKVCINGWEVFFNTKGKEEDTSLDLDGSMSKPPAIPLFSKSQCQYICASRISPEADFRKNTGSVENKQFGKSGEYAVAYIAEQRLKSDKGLHGKSLVNMMFDDNGDALPLENQINYWLGAVSKNVRLDISKITSTKYELAFAFYNGRFWESRLATNSAFGLTYSLPVIAALLAAEAGDIVIIENPESDLHPQAQSKLGELICRCAQNGVQVIIETHSDHILNGIRVAISSAQNIINPADVNILYFYRSGDNSYCSVAEIPIDKHGRMPIRNLKLEGIEGFFDQMDIDYQKLYDNLNANP